MVDSHKQQEMNSKSLDVHHPRSRSKTDETYRVSFTPHTTKERRHSFSHHFKIFRKSSSSSSGDTTGTSQQQHLLSLNKQVGIEKENSDKKNHSIRKILSKFHDLLLGKKQHDKAVQLLKNTSSSKEGSSKDESNVSQTIEVPLRRTPFTSDSSLSSKNMAVEQQIPATNCQPTIQHQEHCLISGQEAPINTKSNDNDYCSSIPAQQHNSSIATRNSNKRKGFAANNKKNSKKPSRSLSLPTSAHTLHFLDNNNHHIQLNSHSYNNNNNNRSVVGNYYEPPSSSFIIQQTQQQQQNNNKNIKNITTMNIPKKNTSEDDFSMNMDESSLSEGGGIRAITKPPSNIKIMSDEDGVIISSSPTSKPRVTNGQIQEEILDPIFDFFKQNTNYDLMPYSGKVIVFDIDLPVREAFQVAANNDISFASLWDSEKSCLVGMLTVTDLIDILLLFHNQMDVIQDLVTHKTIREWRAMQKRTRPDKLIFVTPEDTLLTAIHTLSKYSIHRLPVLSPKGALLHIITHSHLLAYLVQNLKFESPIFQYSLEDLGIGTYTNVVTAKMEMQLFAAVCMFAKYKVSAIPVVNEEGCVVDVFSRYDIVYFVRDGDYRLEMTLGDALRTRPRIPVFTCTKGESFEKVLRHLSTTRIHRLVCVDEYSRVVGIVSISDIFSFLMKKQEELLSREKDIELLHGPTTTMEDDL